MTIDDFAATLFEEAKRFLEKYDGSPQASAYLHAALNLAMCSLEAHTNAIAEEFLTRPELAAWERSVLAEKAAELVDGEFRLTNRLKMHRLEDRLLFIRARFSTHPIDRSSAEWSSLQEAVRLRNELTHPKGAVSITRDQVARVLKTVLAILDSTYLALYRAGYPTRNLGLQSRLDF